MRIPNMHGDGSTWPRNQQEYDQWLEMERERLDRQHNVIHTLEPLEGWSILLLQRWKPGVVRFHARRGNEFQCGFAKDGIFTPMQLPPP